MSTQQVAYAQKRRSTRIEQAVPLLVQGVGALREPYQEQVSTLSISCHGCTYLSKTEVIQGETVYLDIKLPGGSVAGCSSRALVKWAQKAPGKDKVYQIAVELEIAGNIWGVTSPPTDWFPLRIAEPVDPATLGRELKVVPRKEPPASTPPSTATIRTYHPAKTDAGADLAAPASNPLAQLMVGLGEQIQTMAAHAAATALTQERNRLLEEFRSQLRQEAVKAIQAAILTSREEIVRQAVKELGEAQEAATRNRHAQWRKQIEMDLDSARKHIVAQGNEVTQRVDALATGTLDRVQSRMDATRSEAVDRFVSRIREQVTPMLEAAKDSLHRIEGAESSLRKQSQAILTDLEDQLAATAKGGLVKAQEDLEKTAAAIVGKSDESLQKLFQSFENAARGNLNSLLVAAGKQMTKHLQEKAGAVSKEFTAGLEGHTHDYLEAVGKSLADITKKMPTRSGQ